MPPCSMCCWLVNCYPSEMLGTTEQICNACVCWPLCVVTTPVGCKGSTAMGMPVKIQYLYDANTWLQDQLVQQLPLAHTTCPLHTCSTTHTIYTTETPVQHTTPSTQCNTLSHNRTGPATLPTPPNACCTYAVCGCMPSALMTVLTSLSPRPLQFSTTLVPSARVGHSFCRAQQQDDDSRNSSTSQPRYFPRQ